MPTPTGRSSWTPQQKARHPPRGRPQRRHEHHGHLAQPDAQGSGKREIFNNKDFRIGLSHAIDRQAIIDSAFVGQGEPWQAAPRKESPYLQREARQAIHRV